MTSSRPPESDPMLGQILDGRFELTDFIAAGGMGRVYKAIQRPLERVVAVKLLADLSDGMEEFQRRFFLEASLCARLSHPNIIRIFDYGCHNGATYYIAMEYLEGQTIKELVEKTGPLQPRRAVQITRQVCAALIEAHGAELVHRDLKPSNLFATPDGLGGDFVKILDFGVVKQMAVDMEFTQAGGTLGSPLFMSPEQIQDHELDGRSDLYSLGVVLFQMLTGTLPFSAQDPLQVLMKHLTKAPPALSTANPRVRVPPALEQIVQRALKKSRDERYADAREMLDALTTAEAELPALLERAAAEPQDWNPDALAHGSISDIETGTMPVMDLDVPAPPVVPPPAEEEATQTFHPALERLQNTEIKGYVAFIDLNCPYCYALHERLNQWDLTSKIEWCMVEHASHVLDGPFDLNQEELLSTEVFEVHHRAPDIELMLPPQRCRSTQATRLIVHVQRQFPDKVPAFRRAVYQSLWKDGQDIGENETLLALLREYGLPTELLEMCDEEPPELTAWQEDWNNGDFDHSIPVLTHPESGRVLIGLPDERTLTDFLLAQRSRVVDSTVCYYQQQPSILVCGWMSHLWQLLTDVRGCCEIMQAPTPERAVEILSERAVPDLFIIEGEHVDGATMEHLAAIARSRSVPWVVATRVPSPDAEITALSMGAVEYLPVTGEAQVARTRLNRILKDRYNLERITLETKTDALTQLPTRRNLLEQLDAEWERAERSRSPISLILINIDGFKAYNRAHGYLSGDNCLQELARMLERQIPRRSDMIARFGGNEFAALLPDTEAPAALALAEQLQRSVREEGIENRAAANDSILSASIGVHTVTPLAETSIHELVDGAHQDLRSRRGDGP